MAGHPIYLCYPNETLNPMASGWVAEVCVVMEDDDDWRDWEIVAWEYNMSCSVRINDVSSVIISAPGPCILLQDVQQRVVNGLREKLYGRAVVMVGAANDSTDVLQLITQARDLHLQGDPMLPRKLVVALLLVAKLERHQMWGGRNKGYMWASDIPKGRGIDEKYADQIPAVIHDLLCADVLIFKLSKGKRKYALNPYQRAVIHQTLRSFRFPDEPQEIFERDYQLESARALDDVHEHYFD